MDKAKGSSSKGFSLFMLVAAFAAIVYLASRNLGTFKNILITMVGFGAVILIHEFGHFIVAKVSGIKVEAFSIFFPPVLLGILKTEKGYRIRILPDLFRNESDEDKKAALSFTIGKGGKAGETEYRIGLIPFGGFVKMLGQDDVGPVKTCDDPRSFANKSVSCRAKVIAAGVLFNIISSIIIFMSVFLVGINLTPPVVGSVVPGSPADRAGIVAGDEVVEIDGETEDLDFMNIAVAAALSDVNEPVEMKVRHEDGSVEDFTLVAQKQPDSDLRFFGIDSPFDLTIGKVSDANALFEKTGLLAGDRIRSVNGVDVESHWQLMELMENLFTPKATLLIERLGTEGEPTLVESQIDLGFGAVYSGYESDIQLAHIYSIVPRLKITAADQGSGLQAGDVIIGIDDLEHPTYKELREITTEYKDKELAIKVLRDEKIVEATVVPQQPNGSDRVVIGIGVVLDADNPVVAKTISASGEPEALAIPRGARITEVDGKKVTSFYDILSQVKQQTEGSIKISYRLDDGSGGRVVLDIEGIERPVAIRPAFAEYIPFEPLERIYKATGPVNAIVMGYRRTEMFVAQTYLTLKQLVAGLVSPKELMGPVGILSFSYRVVAEKPVIYYTYLLGLISACIAVVNFLPLPPLDGGLIVILLAEKIKGSALSGRTQEIIAYSGWLFIGGFFLYVTLNDVLKLFR